MVKQLGQTNFNNNSIEAYTNTNNTTNNIINNSEDIETLDLDDLIEDVTITPPEDQQNIDIFNNPLDRLSSYNYISGGSIEYINKESGNIENDDKLRGFIAQGMTDAGDYRIYADCKKDPYTDKVTEAAIIIVDKKGNIVKTLIFDNPKLISHANDLEYDPATDRIYIATMRQKKPLVSFKLSKALECKSSDELKFKNESEMFEQTELQRLSGIAHDKSTDIWYFASGHTVVMVKDGKVIKRIKKEQQKTNYKKHEAQGIFAKDGKLYIIRFNRNNDYRSNGGNNVNADDPYASANMIDIYDEKGEYIKTIPVKAPTTESGFIGELESISYDEKRKTFVGNYYYKKNSYQSSRGYWTSDLPINTA